MSRCDEYRRKILSVENKIRKLKDDFQYDNRSQRREIELLERQLEVLKDKYERSLRRGGC